MTAIDRESRVSCQALQVFYGFVESRGESRVVLQQGLPYSREYLNKSGNWVTYGTMLEIERRTAALFADEPDLFFRVGHSVGETRSLGFLRVISRALLSPWSVYRRIPGLMRRYLFRFFSAEYEQVAWNKLRGTYRFDEDCPPSEAFLETARGVLTSVPLIVGAPPAEVRVTRESDLVFTFDVTVRQWRGLGPYVHSHVVELATWRRRRIEAGQDAVSHLESANLQLQEKIDALTIAKAELEELRDSLAQRVRERTAELEVSRAALADTVSRLEQAHRAKDAFFTGVSHQLKTPLQLILGPLDAATSALAEADEQGSAASAYISAARGKTVGLQRLVAEILDSAKLDSGRMPLEMVDFDIGALVAKTCADLAPLAERKRMVWKVEVPDAACAARADRKLVARALVNLVENAVKYADDEDEVCVRLRDAGDGWTIEVADTGPGIPADQQATVFERFARATDARGRTIEGSGIGLAMVREIAEQHGGGVELHSEVGKGSTFSLAIPKQPTGGGGADGRPATSDMPTDVEDVVTAETLQALMPSESARPAAHLTDGELTSGRRVLIVEDHDELRAFLVGEIGKRHGVLAAADGVQGLEMARSKLPDLVLTDVMMPRMNGYELCRELKADPSTRNVPVILITARHGVEAAIDGFSAQADDFVPKPFALPELLARIETQLRLRALTTTLIRAEKQNMLGLLSAGIAHEVLNPVNAVVNSVPHVRKYIEAINDNRKPRLDADTCGQLLDAIESAGHRIDDMVRSILTFTRSEDGPPRMRIARLSDGINSMLSILQFKMKNGVQVHLDFDFDEEVLCHPELIDQAVANLVVNAIDALPQGRGQIWLRTEATEDHVRIRVRDDGTGVPREQRERIFAPFFTTKAPGRGTGLGLAIGREIVAMHGGTLELSGDVDAGAEFVINLPRRQPGDLSDGEF